MTAGEAIEEHLATLRARQAMPTFLATLRERREAAQCARERALARGDRAVAAELAAVVRGYDRWLAEPASAPTPVAPGPRLVILDLWQA